jgi:transposase
MVLSPLSRHSKKTSCYHEGKSELGGDFSMAKKRQTFKQYTEEFKLAAVQEYMKGSSSYKKVAEKYEIRNCSQLKAWMKKWQHGFITTSGINLN